MKQVRLCFLGADGEQAVSASLRERGHLMSFSYVLPGEEAPETLTVFSDEHGCPLRLQRSSGKLFLKFDPGQVTEGFLETPAGRLGVLIETEALLPEKEGLRIRYRLCLGGEWEKRELGIRKEEYPAEGSPQKDKK